MTGRLSITGRGTNFGLSSPEDYQGRYANFVGDLLPALADQWVEAVAWVAFKKQLENLRFDVKDLRSSITSINATLVSDAPFSRYKRFPEKRVFFRLQQLHISLINRIIQCTEFSGGIKAAERSENRARVGSGSVAPVLPNSESDDLFTPLTNYNDALLSFRKSLERYLTSTPPAYDRESFEEEHTLTWVPGVGVTPKTPVEGPGGGPSTSGSNGQTGKTKPVQGDADYEPEP